MGENSIPFVFSFTPLPSLMVHANLLFHQMQGSAFTLHASFNFSFHARFDFYTSCKLQLLISCKVQLGTFISMQLHSPRHHAKTCKNELKPTHLLLSAKQTLTVLFSCKAKQGSTHLHAHVRLMQGHSFLNLMQRKNYHASIKEKQAKTWTNLLHAHDSFKDSQSQTSCKGKPSCKHSWFHTLYKETRQHGSRLTHIFTMQSKTKCKHSWFHTLYKETRQHGSRLTYIFYHTKQNKTQTLMVSHIIQRDKATWLTAHSYFYHAKQNKMQTLMVSHIIQRDKATWLTAHS